MSLAGLAAIALAALGLTPQLTLVGSPYKEFENSGCCSGTEVPTPQIALHHPAPPTLRSPWHQLAAIHYKKPAAVVRKGFDSGCSGKIYKEPTAVMRKGLPSVIPIYIKLTAVMRKGWHAAKFPRKSHEDEACDEPSVIPKADHLSRTGPNLETTLDEASDEPSVIPKADRLSPSHLIQSSTVIARRNPKGFASENFEGESENNVTFELRPLNKFQILVNPHGPHGSSWNSYATGNNLSFHDLSAERSNALQISSNHLPQQPPSQLPTLQSQTSVAPSVPAAERTTAVKRKVTSDAGLPQESAAA